MRRSIILGFVLLFGLSVNAAAGVFVRVKPVDAPAGDYVVHVATRPNYGENEHFFVGQTISDSAKGTYYAPAETELDPLRKSVKPLAPSAATQWIDLTQKLERGPRATVSFYFEPKDETLKITDDAVHLLAGIGHDGKDGAWTFTGFKMVDLSELQVRLKAEFQASNSELYRR